jgi:uncharacterized protein
MEKNGTKSMENTTPEPDRPLALPVQAAERIPFVDVLRGLAMLAILIENMALYGGRAYDLQAISSPVERIVVLLIQFTLEAKSYSLLALLFGWGVAMQMARAEARGTRFVPLYLRRLSVLLAFGLLHGILIWSGDVLILYALLGVLLLPFRRCSPRAILVAAGLFLALSIALTAPGEAMDAVRQAYDSATAFLRSETYPQSVYATGTYAQITRRRIQDYAAFNSRLIYYFGNMFGMFLLGLYVGKRGLFRGVRQRLPTVRKAMWIGLGVGVIANALYVWANLRPSWIPFATYPLVRVGARTIGAPALVISYVCAVILVFTGDRVRNARVRQAWRRRLAPLAYVGRMSLSAYLLQSVTCTLIFYRYGLGLYGQVSPAFGLLLALILYSVQVQIGRWWFDRYPFGPLEWLWRTLTYGRRQPLRLGQTYEDLKPFFRKRSTAARRRRTLILASLAFVLLCASALATWYARSQDVQVIFRSRQIVVPVTATPAAPRSENAAPVATPAVQPVAYDPGPIAASGDLLALASTFRTESAMAQIETLTGPPYLGRYAGSPEGWAAGDYIAAQFAEYGLQPAGKEGTFFQPFPVEYRTLAHVPSLVVEDPGGTERTSYALHRDFSALGRWYAGTGTAEGEVVWANDCTGQDFASIEVVDKVVLCRAASVQEAQRNALEHGAAGLLLLTDPEQRPPDFGNTYGESWVPEPIPSFRVFPPVAEGLLSGSGKSVRDLSLAFTPFSLLTRARMQVSFGGEETCPSEGCQGRNVLGVLPGRDPAYADQVVILGAHYDHLGQAPDGTVWAGANDNASGVAVLLEIARTWHEQGYVPRRTVLFAAWDGEEVGLLGSRYYVAHPRYPLHDTVAKIQLDMVGAGADVLWIDGGGELGARIRSAADALGVKTEITNHGRSDHVPFQVAGVPASLVIWSFEGDALPHYHRPLDGPEIIERDKLEAVGKIVGISVLALTEGEPAIADLLAWRAAAVERGDLEDFLATSRPEQVAADRSWFDDAQTFSPTRFEMQASDLRVLGGAATANVHMTLTYQGEGQAEQETASLAVRFVHSGEGWRWAGPDLVWADRPAPQAGDAALSATAQTGFAVAHPPGKQAGLEGLGPLAAQRYAEMATTLGLPARPQATLLLLPGAASLRASTALSGPPGEEMWVGPGVVKVVYSEEISASLRLTDALARLLLAEAGVPQGAAPWLWQGLPLALRDPGEGAQQAYLPSLQKALAAGTAIPGQAASWAAVEYLRQQVGWDGLGRTIAALGEACRDGGHPGSCEDAAGIDRALCEAIGAADCDPQQANAASFERAWQAYWRERLATAQRKVDALLAARTEAVLAAGEAAFLRTVDADVPNLAVEEQGWFASLAGRPLERFALAGEPLALLEDGSVLAAVTLDYRLADASGRWDEATVPMTVLLTPDGGRVRWAGAPFETLRGEGVSVLYPQGHGELAQATLAQAETTYAQLAADLGVEQPDPLVVKLYESSNAFRASIPPSFPSPGGVPAWAEAGASIKLHLDRRAAPEAYRSTLAVILARRLIQQIGVDAEWLLKGASLYLAGSVDGGVTERAVASHMEEMARAVRKGTRCDLATMPPDDELSADELDIVRAQAWDAVRYLVYTHGWEALVELLETQGQGQDLDTALQTTIGQALPQFEEAWAASLARAHAAPEWIEIARAFDPDQAYAHVAYLASPELAGRQAGSPAAERAATFIAARFAEYGLLPAASLAAAEEESPFLQRFPISTTTLLSAPHLEIVDREGRTAEALAYRQDYVILLSESGGWGEAMGELVWIAAADYSAMDLDGKVVLRRPSQGIESEVAQAAEQGAGGLILVGTKEGEKGSWAKRALPLFFADGRSIPVLELTRQGYQRLLEAVGQTQEGLLHAPPALPLGLEARMAVPLAPPETGRAANVLGWLPGSDPALRGQAILLAAQYDHVGDDPDALVCPPESGGQEAGHRGGAPYPPDCEWVAGKRYAGANDNASGVGVLLEIARTWHESGYRPRHSVIFAAWGAHEPGEMGLRYYLENPAFPLDRTVAAFQLDAVGGGKGYYLDARGTRESEGLLRFHIQAADAWIDDGRVALREPSGTRDPAPLRQAGIPTLSLTWRDASAEHWPVELADEVEPARLAVTGQMVTLALMSIAR